MNNLLFPCYSAQKMKIMLPNCFPNTLRDRKAAELVSEGQPRTRLIMLCHSSVALTDVNVTLLI
jgi:hypothetical protein